MHKWSRVARMSNNWAKSVLVIYLLATLCITILLRPENDSFRFNLTPFWSYAAVEKRPYGGLFVQIILNVILFVPIGALFCKIFKPCRFWKFLLPGIILSAFIEFMQLVLKRGLCEIDDVIHNSLGYMIGYGLCYLIGQIKSNHKKTEVHV